MLIRIAEVQKQGELPTTRKKIPATFEGYNPLDGDVRRLIGVLVIRFLCFSPFHYCYPTCKLLRLLR